MFVVESINEVNFVPKLTDSFPLNLVEKVPPYHIILHDLWLENGALAPDLYAVSAKQISFFTVIKKFSEAYE